MAIGASNQFPKIAFLVQLRTNRRRCWRAHPLENGYCVTLAAETKETKTGNRPFKIVPNVSLTSASIREWGDRESGKKNKVKREEE